jgi:hypothetical protein
MQQREPRADQSHVVVQRKPADAHVFGAELHGFANGTHIGEEIGVREHHAFGITRRAGGVLQQREVAGFSVAAPAEMQGQRSRDGVDGFVGLRDQLFGVENGGE